MSSKNINQLICDHLLGISSEEDKARLEAWLQADEKHRAFFNQFCNETVFTKQFSKYANIDQDKAWQAFEEYVNRSNRKSLLLRLFKYAAFFLGILAVGTGIWWYSDYTKVTPPVLSEEIQQAIQLSGESGHQNATLTVDGKDVEVKDEASVAQIKGSKKLSTKKNSEFWVTLDDGTRVHLNNNSTLIYPDNFGIRNRMVELSGEAYFMVAHDKSRKFIVHTQDGDIAVYGTEFNVKTSMASIEEDEPSTEIVLVKGSISVASKGKEQMMKPGQKWSVLKGQTSLADVDVEPYIAWNTGTFMFHDCTLEKLMKVLSMWYNLDVVYKDRDISKLRFTGTLDRYESFGHTKRAIEIVTGLKIEVQDGKALIGK